MKPLIPMKIALFAFTAMAMTMIAPQSASACKPGRNCDGPGAPPSPGGGGGGRSERPERPSFPGGDSGRSERPERPRPSQPMPPRQERPERPSPRPERPERPFPPRPERPERPMPPRQERPERPSPPRQERPERPAPPRHDPGLRERREGRGNGNDIEVRRRQIEQRRYNMDELRRREINRYREQEARRHENRQRWWNNSPYRVDRGSWIRSNDYWRGRWDQWYIDTYRPSPIVRYPRTTPSPWPDYGSNWSLAQVEAVAQNMESITETIYSIMTPVVQTSPNREYADRLPRVLAEFADASQAFTDAVYSGNDFTDSLNELFYLESKLLLAEKTLDGYSQSYRVSDEMRTMRYYVSELLWVYRQSY